jgi:putative N6-adenine-specific DNA methylase
VENFFVICPPKLESLLQDEIQEKFSLHFPDSELEVLKVVPGGVEIACALEEGLLLNKILRGATRVLLRVKRQKCRDLPKLYNILKKINWKRYFNSEQLELQISSKKSRVRIEKKILSSANKAIGDYFQANAIKQSVLEKYKESPPNMIYLRFQEDELTVSIDTSGDLLHIRGDRSFRGRASLRENVASLLLRKLFKGLPTENLNLIDPMCGTGTFLNEKLKEQQIQDRFFQYEVFNELLTASLPQINSQPEPSIQLFGFDADTEIIKKNQSEQKNSIEYKMANIFENSSTIEGQNIVVCNPPFGKRVKVIGDKLDFYKSIRDKVIELYSPIRLGMLIPRDFVGKLPGERLYFNFNGIEVCFLSETLK